MLASLGDHLIRDYKFLHRVRHGNTCLLLVKDSCRLSYIQVGLGRPTNKYVVSGRVLKLCLRGRYERFLILFDDWGVRQRLQCRCRRPRVALIRAHEEPFSVGLT